MVDPGHVGFICRGVDGEIIVDLLLPVDPFFTREELRVFAEQCDGLDVSGGTIHGDGGSVRV